MDSTEPLSAQLTASITAQTRVKDLPTLLKANAPINSELARVFIARNFTGKS